MQLAQRLKASGIPAFPCKVTFDDTKQKWRKQPLTVNKEPWADTARRTIDDPAVAWSGCTVVGIPIPAGVVIIDMDTYKPGVSTDMADMILGGALPWAQALLQTTVSGGEHYAFRLPEWDVKQGTNLGGPGSGIDTRVAGLGFICSGEGYAPGPDGFGVFRLINPAALPILPDSCRSVMERVAVEAPQPTDLPTESDRDTDTVVKALAHVDPNERDMWRDIGFALKHYFHDDEAAGYDLWDRWSAGEFWADGEPPTYAADTQAHQWASFAAVREGATITIASLFHQAMVGGWAPPARFDTAGAFGTGAAPVEAHTALIDRIIEHGADTRQTTELIAAIQASGCNEIQALLLRNELKAALKSAKVLDKDLAAVIDKQTTPATAPTIGSTQYEKNHTLNAQLYLQTNHGDDSLLRSDEVWYAYDNRCWVEIDDADMDHRVTSAMLPSFPQRSAVTGTYQMLSSMVHNAHARMNESPKGLIIFQNGVLDVHTGRLMPHDISYVTTKIVPYDFDPGANAPHWLAFLNETLEGDQERIGLLQEWFGYMMSPTYEHHKIMLMLGPRRCGKSTIGRILERLVGSMNYTGLSLASLADDDYLDSLRHKTVAFSGDTAKSVGRNAVEAVIERLKKISGNDSIDFGRKYKSRMSCNLPTRLTLAANHIPRLFDDSEALAGRMLVLPFEVSFIGRENTHLIDSLFTEMEGIALWSLQGLARLNANGSFTVPAASSAETDYISEAFSPMRKFITEVCTLGGDSKVWVTDLYNTYKAWALNSGEDSVLPQKTFTSAFKDATRGQGCKYGPQRIGGEVNRGFRGVSTGAVPSATEGAFTPTIVEK